MPKQQSKRSKKPTLGSFDPVIQQAATLKNAQSAKVEAPADPYRPSAINLRLSTWHFLQDVARARSRKAGKGRASVSALIEQLINENRGKLEKELVV